VVKVWSNSVNKNARHLANNVFSGLSDAGRHERTLWKHNASGVYIGGGIKMV